MSSQVSRRSLLKTASLVGAASAVGVAGAGSLGVLNSSRADAYNLALPATPVLNTPVLNHNPASDLIFTSNFNTQGFQQYKNFHPENMVVGRDVGITKDPTGKGGVAWLDSKAGLTHGNVHGRASLETPARFYSSAHGNLRPVYGHKIRIWLPKESSFTSSGDWCALMGVHGSPWKTGSATGMMVVFNPKTGNHFLRMGDNRELLAERDTVIPLGRWVDIVQYFNYNFKYVGGWARMFLAYSGGPWKEVPIKGVKGGYRMDVITEGEGSGWYYDEKVAAATARVGVYGNHPMKMLVAQQKVSRTLEPLLDGRTVDGKPLSALGGLK